MNAVHCFVLQQFSEEMSTLLLSISTVEKIWVGGALLWLLPFITLTSCVIINTYKRHLKNGKMYPSSNQ